MRRLLPILLVFLGAATAAAQEDVATFYRGKTVRIMVGVGVGSGYDINARLLARHLAAHIPGHPTVIVQNQPGAGSLTMTNQLYSAGPFDGTAIGASFNGLPTAPLLQPAGVRFEATKINYVGSTNRETQLSYVWHTVPVSNPEDLKRTQVVAGAQAPGSTFDATTKDPAYLAEAEKLRLEIDPRSGEQVAALVAQVAQTPAAIVAGTHRDGE